MRVTAAQIARLFSEEELLAKAALPGHSLTPLQEQQLRLLDVFQTSRERLDPESQRALLDFGIEVISREASRRWR